MCFGQNTPFSNLESTNFDWNSGIGFMQIGILYVFIVGN